MATLQNIGKLKYRGKDGLWHPLPVVVQDVGGGVSTISGKGAPTSETHGEVNQLYRDEDTQKLYICTATDGGYTWAAVSGGSVDVDETLTQAGQAADAKAAGDAIGKKIDKAQGTGNAGKILGIGADGNVTPQDKPVQALAGDSAPTTATAGVVGQEYYVIVNNAVTEMYVCTAVANGTYTWGKVEFGAEIDDTSTEPTKVWSAEKCNQLSEEITGKLNKSGDTLGGKFVIPTADTTAGFVNSEDMKIFGYGTTYFRMGDPNKPLQLRGNGTNPMYGDKKILVEGDVAGDSLLTVETITVGDDSGETETVSVTGLSLDLTTYSATVGNGFYINPVITPSNATNKAVSWQSNATNIATVNDSGYVECITMGNAVITCTTVDGGFTATCAVSVAAVDGGETTGQKIQFSTLAITSGFIKNDGTTATMGNTYNVTIPYSDGMQISTGTNVSWDRSVFPPVVVYDNGTYISPEVTKAGEARSVGGKYVTPFTATLTGFTENAIVHASFLAGGNIGDTLKTNMDNADIFYYIT